MWPTNFVWNARLPRSIQESFTCRKSTSWDRRLYFPSVGEGAEEFFALKNPMASAGFEPANMGTKGHQATSRPPKPLSHIVGNCWTWWWPLSRPKHVVQLTILLRIYCCVFHFLTLYLPIYSFNMVRIFNSLFYRCFLPSSVSRTPLPALSRCSNGVRPLHRGSKTHGGKHTCSCRVENPGRGSAHTATRKYLLHYLLTYLHTYLLHGTESFLRS